MKFFGSVQAIFLGWLMFNLNYISQKWILMYIACQIAWIQMMGGFDK